MLQETHAAWNGAFKRVTRMELIDNKFDLRDGGNPRLKFAEYLLNLGQMVNNKYPKVAIALFCWHRLMVLRQIVKRTVCCEKSGS